MITLLGPDNRPFEVDLTQGGFEFLVAGWRIQEITGALRGLQRDAVCVDIGAHWGVYSRVFSAYCPNGRIYAIEASSSTFQVLMRNCSYVDNIHCERFAVGSTTGTVEFAKENVLACLRSIRAAPDADTESVPCLTLADWIHRQGLTRLDFLKVDVEGFKGDVILPALQLLKAFRTRICFEFIHEMAAKRSPHKAGALMPALEEAGYRIYRLDERGDWHSALASHQLCGNNYVAAIDAT